MIFIDCPDCGQRHQPGVCEGKRKAVPRSHVAEATRETIARMPKVDGPIIKGLKEAIKEASKPKRDRNDYQREFMRKKRARDKAAKEAKP